MANVIRDLVIKVSVDADTKGFEEVDQAQEKTGVGTVAVGAIIADFTSRLVDMGVAAAKAGAAMVKDLVFGTAEAGDEIAKTSQKLGIASDQLQRLRGSAELSGAAAGDLDSAILDLTKNLGESIEKGAGPAVEALATLGLEVAEVDAILQTGDVEGALGLIGDAANELGDPVRKQAALLKIMGGAGKELGPLLETGTDGIREMGDAISATGSVIEDDALAQFSAMQDANLLLEKQVDGVKVKIATGLAPVVTDIADRVGGWIDENQDFIQQDLPRIMEDVGNSILAVAEFTFELLTSWREFIRDASDLVEILTTGVDPALGDVGEGLTTVTGFADGLALALSDVVVQFLEAVGAGEELIQVFREIKAGIAGDDGPKGQRGAPGFAGGGSALANPADIDKADTSGDTTKLRQQSGDPKFSDADRAKFAANADRIDAREAAKAQAEATAAAVKRDQGVQASRARAKAAQKTQRAAIGGGGGGGGGAAQPTVAELITGATGAATGGPQAVAGASALAGTMLINVDQSVNITNGPVELTLEIPQSIADSGSPEDLAAFFRREYVALRDADTRMDLDRMQARRNVGGG
jgi:hypothetical protein